jgi:hypothetical protein
MNATLDHIVISSRQGRTVVAIPALSELIEFVA